MALQASQKCIHSNGVPESLRRHVKYKRKIEPPSKELNNLEVLQVLESHLEFPHEQLYVSPLQKSQEVGRPGCSSSSVHSSRTA